MECTLNIKQSHEVSHHIYKQQHWRATPPKQQQTSNHDKPQSTTTTSQWWETTENSWSNRKIAQIVLPCISRGSMLHTPLALYCLELANLSIVKKINTKIPFTPHLHACIHFQQNKEQSIYRDFLSKQELMHRLLLTYKFGSDTTWRDLPTINSLNFLNRKYRTHVYTTFPWSICILEKDTSLQSATIELYIDLFVHAQFYNAWNY